MQQTTAALIIGLGSCFLAANDHAVAPRSPSDISIELRISNPALQIGDDLQVKIMIGTDATQRITFESRSLSQSLDSWWNSAMELLTKKLRMA